MISVRALTGQTVAEYTPLYQSWNVPYGLALTFSTVTCTTMTQMHRKQFIVRGRLSVNSFRRTSPNESQASINRHRQSLAHYGNKSVFSMVSQEWASFPSSSFFRLLLLFSCLGLRLKILLAPCLSSILLIALAVRKHTLCQYADTPVCGEMLYKVSYFE